MKKQDLKDGMMVKDREGSIYLVFNKRLEALVDNFEWDYIDGYENDMTYEECADLDIMEVRDARDTKYSIYQRFTNYNVFPIIWKREEEYNFKPGDKVQVRDREDEEWQNAYFIQKIEDDEVYKWSTTIRDEFTAGMNFEEMNCKIGTPWVYIRPYKEG